MVLVMCVMFQFGAAWSSSASGAQWKTQQGVVGEGDAVRVPALHEPRDHLGALLRGSRRLEAHTVHATEAAVLDDLFEVGDVVRVVRVADDDAAQVGALLLEDALLVEAGTRSGVRVGADRDAGLAVSARRRAEHAFVHEREAQVFGFERGRWRWRSWPYLPPLVGLRNSTAKDRRRGRTTGRRRPPRARQTLQGQRPVASPVNPFRPPDR